MNITEVILINFTNNPYECIMKEVLRYEKARPAEGPGRIALCGVSLLAGDLLCFLLLEVLQRAELIC